MNNRSEQLMKTITKLLGTTAVAAALGVSLAAHAGIYTFSSGSISQVIPDNQPSGVAYAMSFGASGLQITDVSVTFTTVGGWNGDLYAYLSHGDGFAVLLNRVGAPGSSDGYGTPGFTGITLAMSATTDIHGVASPTTEGGPYAADGRLVYTDTARNNTLGVFNNMDPNGGWTLFFADRAAVNTSTLTGWSLDITAVPEPVNVALGCFAGVFLVVTLIRNRRVRTVFCVD
jgi:hypothetical protein